MRAFCPPKNSPEKDIVMTPEYLAKDIINHFNPTGKYLIHQEELVHFMITFQLIIKIGVS